MRRRWGLPGTSGWGLSVLGGLGSQGLSSLFLLLSHGSGCSSGSSASYSGARRAGLAEECLEWEGALSFCSKSGCVGVGVKGSRWGSTRACVCVCVCSGRSGGHRRTASPQRIAAGQGRGALPDEMGTGDPRSMATCVWESLSTCVLTDDFRRNRDI